MAAIAVISRQYFVGFGNQIGWESQTNGRRCLLIQVQLVRFRMLYRDITRLLTFDNLIRITRAHSVLLALIRRPRHESSRLDEKRRLVNRR